MSRSPVFFADDPKANGSFADAAHKVNSAKSAAADKPRASEAASLTNAAAQIEAKDEWWIQVRASAYGPYTSAQVRQFIAEGRVRPATQVARDRAGPWSEARKTAEFADALTAQTRPAEAPHAAAVGNLFVCAEIHSGAWNAFMAALERMGRVAELAPGFWLVRSPFSSGVLRNTLSQTLERGDRFVVIDATRDRLAWFNMGPGVDVAIREVWNAPLEASKYQA
jgi:hypothetical protein